MLNLSGCLSFASRTSLLFMNYWYQYWYLLYIYCTVRLLVVGWVSVSCPQTLEDDMVPEGEKTLFDWTKEGRLDKIQVS
jgi:hypothetical protein